MDRKCEGQTSFPLPSRFPPKSRGRTDQEFVDALRHAPPLVDGPYDQGLSPPAVSRRENPVHVRPIITVVGPDVVALVHVQREARGDRT
jgi:hypothetical protein